MVVMSSPVYLFSHKNFGKFAKICDFGLVSFSDMVGGFSMDLHKELEEDFHQIQIML